MLKDGKKIVLTKQQAIDEHQKMWNWIADQYKAGRTEDVLSLKEEFCFKNGIVYLINYCFCCDYASDDCIPKCEKCPIVWCYFIGRFCCESRYSLYKKIFDLTKVRCSISNTKKAEKLARKIANLPVRVE